MHSSRERRPKTGIMQDIITRWRSFTSNRVLFWLTMIWLSNLIICEWFYFDMTMRSCAYEPISELEGDPNYLKKVNHVALIADPQIISKYTYSHIPQGILSRFVTFLGDAYMKTCFRLMLTYHQPDAVIFLGDLMDATIQLSKAEYLEHLDRFQWIFSRSDTEIALTRAETTEKRKAILSDNSFVADIRINLIRKYTRTDGTPYEVGTSDYIPAFYIPGNHDIGMFTGPEVLVDWWKSNFGVLNYAIMINKFAFISVSTPLLEDPHKHPQESKETLDFMHGIGVDVQNSGKLGRVPRVLLTHMPLYRASTDDCGPYKRAQIRDVIGSSYQNMVSQKVTSDILGNVRPFYVFSGDDHDYCSVEHFLGGTARELTVATFSWMEGTNYPGYVLLSFYNPANNPDCERPEFKQDRICAEPLFNVRACYSPQRKTVYIWYGVAFIATVVVLSIASFHSNPLHYKKTEVSLIDESLTSKPEKQRRFRSVTEVAQDVLVIMRFGVPMWIFLMWFML